MLIRVKRKKSLIDVFDEWKDNGIFKRLSDNYVLPWEEEVTDPSVIDLDYYGNYSGGKGISPLVERLLDANKNLTENEKERLVALIYYKYINNWKRLWDAYHKEYDPIDNFHVSIHENSKDNKTTSGSDTKNGSTKHTGTDSSQHSGDVKTDVTGTPSTHSHTDGDSTDDQGTYAFDSQALSPKDKVSGVSHDDTQVDETLDSHTTETDSRVVTDIHDTTDTDEYVHTNTGSENGSREGDITKKGSLGTESLQGLIESEMNLRKNYNFFRDIYKDVDEVMTSGLYYDEDDVEVYIQ